MTTLLHFYKLLFLTSLVVFFNVSLSAQNKQNDYTFPQKQTPVSLIPCGKVVVFGYNDRSVYAPRANELSTFNGKILNVKFNPTGASYIVVNSNKKTSEAKVFYSNVYNGELYKFNTKKTGVPQAATYTSDARKLLLATDRGILVMSAINFQPIDTIPAPFAVTDINVSDNNYYLLLRNEHQVAVYNFEEKKLRKKWKFDEKVTKVGFSNDNSELAILTDDGVLSIYDARSFLIKKNIEGLGQGLSFTYNHDGKYVAVATAPNLIVLVNLLNDTDREHIEVPAGGMSAVEFLIDSQQSQMLAYNATKSINVKRLTSLAPNYNKLVADGADELMHEWLKMMPGETMEEYRARVNDESRAKQRRLFEDKIATDLAGDLASMSKISLGKYDRSNQMLSLEFDNMPSIFLPIPEEAVGAFKNPEDISIEDAQYGVLPNDNFELIYAKFHNKTNNETYIYNNLDRVPLNFEQSDDNMVSLDILQQQQMEELKLQELKQKVVEEAKSRNVISDHTNITVDSRIENAYDANGKKILNYKVKISYEVESGFSVQEDFGPGKYQVDESGAAKSMLALVKQAFEGDFKQYIEAGKKLSVSISGMADATPIRNRIAYNGVYGNFDNEPVYQNGQLAAISINQKDGIQRNEQLAFLRAYGVKDYLERNVEGLNTMNRNYTYSIAVAEGKGSEFRRIIAEFTFVDAF
ncbi:WD40 repeat domain-containing protein [Odoribacter lunatus]|uniref:WD40 repeat domain-containing protein n=1 Tax=Odoribacter lunatus TaxID=2941335 RepID=UPI00203BCDF3|nr:WD40 repeat domain-containing protein [Odoribacter lunatus]